MSLKIFSSISEYKWAMMLLRPCSIGILLLQNILIGGVEWLIISKLIEGGPKSRIHLIEALFSGIDLAISNSSPSTTLPK